MKSISVSFLLFVVPFTMGFAFVGTGSVGRSHNKAHKRWLDNVGLRYSLEGRTVDNPVEPLTNFVFVKVDE